MALWGDLSWTEGITKYKNVSQSNYWIIWKRYVITIWSKRLKREKEKGRNNSIKKNLTVIEASQKRREEAKEIRIIKVEEIGRVTRKVGSLKPAIIEPSSMINVYDQYNLHNIKHSSNRQLLSLILLRNLKWNLDWMRANQFENSSKITSAGPIVRNSWSLEYRSRVWTPKLWGWTWVSLA